jgi:hypothetical protein
MSDALELDVQGLDVRKDAAAWDAARLLLARSLQTWEEGQDPIVYRLDGATLRIAEHIAFEGDAQRRATWLMQTIPRPGGLGIVYSLMLVLLYGGVAVGFAHALLPGLALSDVRKALDTLKKAKDTLTAAGVKVPDPGTLVVQGAEKLTMAWALALWKSVRSGLIVLGLGIAAAVVDYVGGPAVSDWIKAHLGVVAMAVTPLLVGLTELARQWIKAAQGKYTTP